jgi:MerR family redox-sensitive transcriptional activator SoxR
VESLTIGEVAKRAGLRPSALRYYESAGLIPKPAREGGRRIYAADVVDRLAVIALAQSAGFTLAEIRRLLGGLGRRAPGERWRQLAEGKLAELDRRLEEVSRMKRLLAVLVACECPSVDDCGRALRDERFGGVRGRRWPPPRRSGTETRS